MKADACLQEMAESALSLSQREILLEYKMAPASNIHTIGGYIHITGPLDRCLFQRALTEIIRETETFGTRLCEHEGNACLSFSIPTTEVPFFDFGGDGSELMAWMKARFLNLIDLMDRELFEFALLRENPSSHFWFIKVHHFIIDGWGISLLGRSVAARYNALIDSTPSRAVADPLYREFVVSDCQYLDSRRHAADQAYWSRMLGKFSEPLFSPRSGAPSSDSSERLEDVLDAVLNRKLNDFCSAHQATTFAVLMAWLYAYFSRAFLRSELSFGYPIRNRSTSSAKEKIGLFARLLPLQISASSSYTFLTLVRRIGQILREDARYSRCPISKMRPGLPPSRMFDIVASYERHDYNLQFGECSARAVSLSNGALPHPLSIFIQDFVSGGDVRLVFDYHPKFFETSDVSRHTLNLKNLLIHCLESPDSPIKDFEIVSPAEIVAVRSRFNARAVALPGPARIIDLFEAQVEKTPHCLALVGNGRRLTYVELSREADALAERILELPDSGESPIGLFLGRDYETVISILAVWKVGRFFVPIDPGYPDHHVYHMLEDSGCRIALTLERYLARVATVPHRLDVGTPAASGPRSTRMPDRNCDVAYIMYTSGSTGAPKGVVVTQAGILNMAYAQARQFRVTPDDNVLQFASFSFDASIFEVCMALLSGATLVMATGNVIDDPAALENFLLSEGITIATLPPSYLQIIPHRQYPRLRILITAGEAPRLHDVAFYCPLVEYYNAYGPTESSVWTTIRRIMPGTDSHSVVFNIGVPIPNLSVWILDPNLKMVPMNCFGEICIGGTGLAKGYLNNDEKTKQHFGQNPYRPEERIYRSGDRGRWLPDGTIELAGRLDEQLKIRGFRIEPGEIERHLLAHPDISSAVVVGRASSSSDCDLTAYVVFAGRGSPPNALELRRILHERLPGFMVPAYFVFVASIPLNHNGKIDRKALAEMPPPGNEPVSENPPGPTTALEKAIMEVWNDILPSRATGIQDSFFDLGGNSMDAIKIASRLANITGFPVHAGLVLTNFTVSRLAAALGIVDLGQTPGLPPPESGDFHQATPAQEQIWVAHELAEDKTLYNVLACYHVTGPVSVSAFLEAVRTALLGHDLLRASFADRGGKIGFSIHSGHEVDVPIPVINFGGADDASITAAVVALHNIEFDLSQPPLVRVSLLQRSETNRLLVMVFHHLVCDWLSIEILQEEIRLFYKAAVSPSSKPLASSVPAFQKYAAWLNSTREDTEQHERYWSEVFRDPPSIISLGQTHGRRLSDDKGGGLYESPLSEELTRAIQSKALAWQTTLYTVLFSSLNVLLYKYTGQTDIVMGTIIADRESQYSTGVVGCLMNTVPVRTRFLPTDSFSRLFKRVELRILEAHKHQRYPLHLIFNRLNMLGGAGAPPFSVMVDMLYTDRQDSLNLEHGVVMNPAVIDCKKSKYDLTIYIMAGGKAITTLYEYRLGIFTPLTIQAFAIRWEKLLGLLLRDDERDLRSVDLDEIPCLPQIHTRSGSLPHR